MWSGVLGVHDCILTLVLTALMIFSHWRLANVSQTNARLRAKEAVLPFAMEAMDRWVVGKQLAGQRLHAGVICRGCMQGLYAGVACRGYT